MNRGLALLFLGLTALGAPLVSAAQAQSTDPTCEPAMLVFDASGSMRGTRIVEARRATQRVLPALTRARPVGLVTYGGRVGPVCGTIDVKLPPVPGSGPAIQAEIDALDPTGRTPIAGAVAQAAAVLGGGARRGLVVLVSDGEENCAGDPCALGHELRAAGGRLRVHVIGYRLRVPEGSALACLARQTGGIYAEAGDTEALAAALENTLGCTPVSNDKRRVIASNRYSR